MHHDCPSIHRKLIDTGRILLAFSHYSVDLIAPSVWQRRVRRYRSKKTSNRSSLICICNIFSPWPPCVNRAHPRIFTNMNTSVSASCVHSLRVYMHRYAPARTHIHCTSTPVIHISCFFSLSPELCMLVSPHVLCMKCGGAVVSAVKSEKHAGCAKKPRGGHR